MAKNSSGRTAAKRAINLKFPLSYSNQGALATNYTTIDAVKDDLRILLLTNHNERPINANFGANLRQFVFRQQSEELNMEIETAIVGAIDQWMPFITIDDIQVINSHQDSSLGNNQILVKLSFLVGNLEGELVQSINIG